jgi:serine-type D-Ala-D-Ala carboxypeptidase (penicillin-binding protein 5/6)
MTRRILALLLGLSIAIAVPVLAFTPAGTRILQHFSPDPTPIPSPILTVRGTPPAIGARAAYLLDADTGHVLDDFNGERRLPMASTAKIMTALITIETEKLDQSVTIHQDAFDEVQKNSGSSASLVVGDQISLKDLLYGLMLPSGDDAAIAIADAVSGSPARFVQLMNAYAHRLHLNSTHYTNPDGLDFTAAQNQATAANQYSTAADLVHLSRYALTNSLFAQIVELQQYNLPATALHHAYSWATTNTLLGTYAGATGVKTGSTPEAGFCLVFSATNAGHHLLGALMHASTSAQRFADAKSLLDWGFNLPLLPPPASQNG